MSTTQSLRFLTELEKLLQNRKQELPEDSYSSFLFRNGVDKIAQKVGEEAIETIIASKNSDDEEFINESADLLYHLIMLLVDRGIPLKDIVGELERRNRS
jgi:phosphoribosyl-ATP pyrophosphohydrolase